MVQTCLHTGLSAVYDDLLGFDGDEIYIGLPQELTGESSATPSALENCSSSAWRKAGRFS